MSTTSSEAGLLVGGFLRPFLSYNKDTFCRALLRCSPSPLVLSFPPPLLSFSLSVSLHSPSLFLLLFAVAASLFAFSFYLLFSFSLSSLNKCLFLLSAVLFFFSPSPVFLRAFLLLFPPFLSRASLSRSFHPLCSASGPFVYPSPFQPVSFVLSHILFLSFVLGASSSPCCSLLPSLSFHSGLSSPLTRARSPAARASEVFLNRSTTGGCCRAALFSSHVPKSFERRD